MAEQTWETLRLNENYEICTEYPYNIRKKSTRRILKEHQDACGYWKVAIDQRPYSKHRIIAEQWLENDDPQNKTDVDHINKDRTDNHLSNLRWVTKSDNCRNKKSYNGVEIEYLDELPPQSVPIILYKGAEFENYFYSRETGECYFFNGVAYRTLPYHTAPSGMIYFWAQDITNTRRCIYIQAWLKSEVCS